MIITQIMGGGSSSDLYTLNVTWPSGSTCWVNGASTGFSKNLGTSGSGSVNISKADTYTASCSNGSKSASEEVSVESTIQSCELSYITYLRIGGRIFYDNGDNGNTYMFFDSSKNEITDWSLTSDTGLKNAYYYAITSGSSSTDRWYVYDTAGLTSSLYWGYYGTTTGVTTNSIGSGKTNTQTILNRGVPTDYSPNIWSFIKGKRDANYNDCNDWFIASEAEQDKLKSSGLVSWYDSNYIWSSVEYNSDCAYLWRYYSIWDYYRKNVTYYAFAARAF